VPLRPSPGVRSLEHACAKSDLEKHAATADRAAIKLSGAAMPAFCRQRERPPPPFNIEQRQHLPSEGMYK
jgi:hypothetical protein